MSEPRVTVGQDEAGAGRGEKEAKSAPLKQPSNEASRPGQLGLVPLTLTTVFCFQNSSIILSSALMSTAGLVLMRPP